MITLILIGVALLMVLQLWAQYVLFMRWHQHVLLSALSVVAHQQPALKVVPTEKPPEKPKPTKAKVVDDDKLEDLYTKLHGSY